MVGGGYPHLNYTIGFDPLTRVTQYFADKRTLGDFFITQRSLQFRCGLISQLYNTARKLKTGGGLF